MTLTATTILGLLFTTLLTTTSALAQEEAGLLQYRWQKTVQTQKLIIELKTKDGRAAKKINYRYEIHLCLASIQPKMQYPYQTFQQQNMSCTLSLELKKKTIETSPEGLLTIPSELISLPSQTQNAIPSSSKYFSRETWFIDEQKFITNRSGIILANELLPNAMGPKIVRCFLSHNVEEWNKIINEPISEDKKSLPVASIEKCEIVSELDRDLTDPPLHTEPF